MNEYLAKRVKNLTDVFLKENGTFPEFEDLIKECIYLKDLSTADCLFNSLKEGWLLNGFKELDFKELHTKIFKYDKAYHFDELLDELSERKITIGGPTTIEELNKLNNKIIKSAGGNTSEE